MEQDNSIYGYLIFALWCLGLWLIFTRPTTKIWQPTPSKLIFNIRPIFFWVIPGTHGLIGILILLSTFFFSPSITTLTCEHFFQSSSLEKIEFIPHMVRCEIEQISWLGLEKKESISQLKGATLETEVRRNDDREKTFYHITLLTDKNKIPLSWDGDFNRESYEALTNRINTFVENGTDNNLTIQEDKRELAYVGLGIGGFLILVSLLLFVILPATSCTLDRDSGSFTFKHRRSFGIRTFTFRLALNDIAKVLEEYGEGVETTSTSRITLILKSGETFPLTQAYSSASKKEIVTAIENFLKTHRSGNEPDCEISN